MGWDVVQIGLNHNLPVEDPFETAKEVAKRMNRNIKLGYMKEYEYDVDNNVVYYSNDFSFVELGNFDVDDSNECLRMEVRDYQANQILKTVGIDNIRIAATKNDVGKMLLSNIEEDPYSLYEIDEDSENLTICKENVELWVDIFGRWSCWERAFHSQDTQDIDLLHDYRIKIFNRAQIFGCNEVVICADQGPGELIYSKLNYSADSLKEYARSYQYLRDCEEVTNDFDMEDWKKHAKHISFASFFKNEVVLNEGDFIEVIFDDFSDLKETL